MLVGVWLFNTPARLVYFRNAPSTPDALFLYQRDPPAGGSSFGDSRLLYKLRSLAKDGQDEPPANHT